MKMYVKVDHIFSWIQWFCFKTRFSVEAEGYMEITYVYVITIRCFEFRISNFVLLPRKFTTNFAISNFKERS